MPRFPAVILLIAVAALACGDDDDAGPSSAVPGTQIATQPAEASSTPEAAAPSPTPSVAGPATVPPGSTPDALVRAVGPVEALMLVSGQRPSALPPELFVYDVELSAEILRESESYFRMWLAANAPGIVREGGGNFFRYDDESASWQAFNLGTGGLSASFSEDGSHGAVGVGEDIWLLDFEAGTQQRVTSDALLGSWSPDAGRLLLFIRDQPEGMSHYAVLSVEDPAGAAHVPLGASTIADAQHSGRWLDEDHFMLVSEGANLLQVYDVGGASAQIVLEESIESDQAVVSPDGRLLAIGSRDGGANTVVIYAMDPFGELARLEDATLGQYLEVAGEVWAPDGARLLTLRSACSEDERLVSYAVDSGQEVELARDVSFIYRFGFSPDGAWAAFTTHASNAYVVPANGGAPAVLVSEDANAPAQPRWLPDASRVAFARYQGGYDICLGG